jgi:hypothetical protein
MATLLRSSRQQRSPSGQLNCEFPFFALSYFLCHSWSSPAGRAIATSASAENHPTRELSLLPAATERNVVVVNAMAVSTGSRSLIYAQNPLLSRDRQIWEK